MSATRKANFGESPFHFRLMAAAFAVRDFLRPRRKVIDDLGIRPGHRVLDFGCSTGSYILPLSELAGQQGKVYALDKHPLAIKSAENIIRRNRLTNVEVIHSECHTALPDKSVDRIILYDILHYPLANIGDILAELYRILKPDGLLCVRDHHLKDNELMNKISSNGPFALSGYGKSVCFKRVNPPMKHIVVISGKGGTGKTTLTASLCALAEKPVIIDCDVDAADMHLLTHPQIRRSEDFTGGKYAVIDAAKCVKCGKCREVCRFDAITKGFKADIFSCEGCGLCERVCPAKAIAMTDRLSGKWFVSDTKYGVLVHAELGIGEENSGKLVSKVKQTAFDIANASAAQWVIADGPPGTGCPVMASLSGAHLAVVVTEPTLSAIQDMKRAVETASHFNIPSAVIINKWDLNENNTVEVEKFCKENNVALLGRISFNQAASEAVAAGVPLVEYGNARPSDEIKAIWSNIQERLNAGR